MRNLLTTMQLNPFIIEVASFHHLYLLFFATLCTFFHPAYPPPPLPPTTIYIGPYDHCSPITAFTSIHHHHFHPQHYLYPSSPLPSSAPPPFFNNFYILPSVSTIANSSLPFYLHPILTTPPISTPIHLHSHYHPIPLFLPSPHPSSPRLH